MGCCLTSWFSKKLTALAISMTKAEYVSARKACQQVLWRKQALIDYDIRLDDVPIMKTIKEKGKRADPPSSSSSSSSSDENKEPSFLDFCEELSANEELNDEQKEKRRIFKCMNRYLTASPST
ncbi:hypothetical protein Tco_0576888 [Tanacetum coccineum]